MIKCVLFQFVSATEGRHTKIGSQTHGGEDIRYGRGIADRTVALLSQYIHNDSYELISTIKFKLFLFFFFPCQFSRPSLSSFCNPGKV